MDTVVEINPPKCDRWLKHVKSVAERAKNGYDWDGDFIKADGRLADLPVGALLAECDAIGSRKHPKDRVVLSVVHANGFVRGPKCEGKEWGVKLRQFARDFLAIADPEERVQFFVTPLLEEARTTLAKERDSIEQLETKVAEDLAFVAAIDINAETRIPSGRLFNCDYVFISPANCNVPAQIQKLKDSIPIKAGEKRKYLLVDIDSSENWIAELEGILSAIGKKMNPKEVAIGRVKALMSELNVTLADLA